MNATRMCGRRTDGHADCSDSIDDSHDASANCLEKLVGTVMVGVEV